MVFPKVLELRPPLLASALPDSGVQKHGQIVKSVWHGLHSPLWAASWLCNLEHLCFPGFSFFISNTERMKLFIPLGFYEH